MLFRSNHQLPTTDMDGEMISGTVHIRWLKPYQMQPGVTTRDLAKRANSQKFAGPSIPSRGDVEYGQDSKDGKVSHPSKTVSSCAQTKPILSNGPGEEGIKAPTHQVALLGP